MTFFLILVNAIFKDVLLILYLTIPYQFPLVETVLNALKLLFSSCFMLLVEAFLLLGFKDDKE